MAEGSILTLQLARILAEGAFSVSGGTNTAAQAISQMAGGQLAALQAQEAEDKRKKNALPGQILGGIGSVAGGFAAGGPIGAIAAGSGSLGSALGKSEPVPSTGGLAGPGAFGGMGFASLGSGFAATKDAGLNSINNGGELKLSDFFRRNR